MFKQLGQISNLLTQLPRLKEEMERLQQRMGQVTAEGAAGGGLVRVRVNGRFEMLACQLSDDALALNDREMLEDLIRSAANQALERVRQQMQEETAKMATSMGLPPGFDPSSFGG